MAKLKPTNNKKARFAVYSSEKRFVKNKKRALERHLKTHSDDTQAQSALKNVANLAKPSRSVHVSSGNPVYKDITEFKIVKGKSTEILVKRIKLSRLDQQLIKRATKTQVHFKDDAKVLNESFKSVSLSNCLTVAKEHFDRILKEKEAKQKAKEAKNKPSKQKPKKVNKTSK